MKRLLKQYLKNSNIMFLNKNNELHRLNGPALFKVSMFYIHCNATYEKAYTGTTWLYGVKCSKRTWNIVSRCPEYAIAELILKHGSFANLVKNNTALITLCDKMISDNLEGNSNKCL